MFQLCIRYAGYTLYDPQNVKIDIQELLFYRYLFGKQEVIKPCGMGYSRNWSLHGDNIAECEKLLF